MPYSLKETPDRIEVEVASEGRDSLVKDALCATLEAVYGKGAGGSQSGQVVPLQAAGKTLSEALPGLVSTLLETAVPGCSLLPPRWLAFDEGRITAVLPVSDVELPARGLRLERAVVDGAGKALFVLAKKG